MNIDLTHKHRKVFAQLLREQKNLDYRMSVAARDLRADCASDAAFIKWLDTEFGMSPGQAKELLRRAAAVKVVPTADDWNALGGFSKIEPVLEFPKREQAQIINTAKVEARSIPSVIRAIRPISPSNPAPGPTKSERKQMRDAELFAKFIVDNAAHLKIPGDVLIAVQMYVPSFRPGVAPAVQKRRAVA